MSVSVVLSSARFFRGQRNSLCGFDGPDVSLGEGRDMSWDHVMLWGTLIRKLETRASHPFLRCCTCIFRGVGEHLLPDSCTKPVFATWPDLANRARGRL